MVFNQFREWIEQANALKGFDLSNRLMLELFADLDPQKKGYLTEID